MPKKRFELEAGSSSKFWEVETKGSDTIVCYGRIGTDGRVLEKSYDSPAGAKQAVEKLVEQKTAKGYEPVSRAAKKASVKAKASNKKKAVKKKAKAAKKKAAKRKELAKVPFKAGDIVDVTGMIQAFHSGAHADSHDENCTWTHIAVFQKWRITRGEIMPGEMQIRELKLSENQTSSRMARYEPYSLHRVEVKMSRARGFDCWIGTLVKYRGKAKDTDFEKKAAKLQETVVFKDSKLGKFEFDRAFSLFESKRTKWVGNKCVLSLHVKNAKKYEKCLEHAHRIFAKQAAWNKKVLDFAVQKLLTYANGWRAEEMLKPLSAAGFRKILKVYSVEVYESGRATFWVNAGNTFQDHAVQVEVAKSGKPRTANIA